MRALVLAATLAAAVAVMLTPAQQAAAAPQLRGAAGNIFTAKTIGHAAFTAHGATDGGLNGFTLVSATMLDAPEALAEISEEMAALKAAGGQVIRISVPWALLETDPAVRPGDPPKFNQVTATRLGTFLGLATQFGLKTIVSFGSTPCGRSSKVGKDCSQLTSWTSYPATNPADMGDAAKEMIRRWGAHIYAIEVWNEPNIHFFMSDLAICDPAEPAQIVGRPALETRARAYVPLVKAVWNGVKSSVRPSIKVVAGDPSFSDTEWLQLLYANGMKGFYDAISIHPYHLWLRYVPTPTSCEHRKTTKLIATTQDPSVPFPDPMFSFTTGVQAVHDTMVANGDTKPLWFTEFGFASCGAVPPELRQPLGQASANADWSGSCAGPLKQGEYLAESYKIAARWPFVEVAAMFTTRDPTPSMTGLEGSTWGVLRQDGTPKPGYVALRDAWDCLAKNTC